MTVVHILKELIKKQSITPNDAGCMDFIETCLKPLGFRFYYFNRNETKNMYAEVGSGPFNFCFAGHTDVVPTGDLSSWDVPPFDAVIKDGKIFGRGTCDMKGGIAAFIAALYKLQKMPTDRKISLLLTSDEEGDAKDGIQYVMPLLESQKLLPSLCLVGEPTCNHESSYIKVGRRGSFNAIITITGIMGHVAYQKDALNPHYPLEQLLNKLVHYHFDSGTETFAPTNLEITNINSFNDATNIIPEKVQLRFNIRFNTNHTKETLQNNISDLIDEINKNIPGYKWDLKTICDSNADICEDKDLISLIEEASKKITGKKAICTTDGATSDARFIQKYCPVLEFGLLTNQAHQINEHVLITELENLSDIYFEVLNALSNRDLTSISKMHTV